jgi:hypothetical protein
MKRNVLSDNQYQNKKYDKMSNLTRSLIFLGLACKRILYFNMSNYKDDY